MMAIFLGLWWFFTKPSERLSRKARREEYIQATLDNHAETLQVMVNSWEQWNSREVRDYIYARGGQVKDHVAQAFLETRIRGANLKYLTKEELRSKLEIKEHEDRQWVWQIIKELRSPDYKDPDTLEHLKTIGQQAHKPREIDDDYHKGRITEEEVDERWLADDNQDMEEEEISTHLRYMGTGTDTDAGFDVYGFGEFLVTSDAVVRVTLWNNLTNGIEAVESGMLRALLYPFVTLYLRHFRIPWIEEYGDQIEIMVNYLKNQWREEDKMDMMNFSDLEWMGERLMTKGLQGIQGLAEQDEWMYNDGTKKVEKEDSYELTMSEHELSESQSDAMEAAAASSELPPVLSTGIGKAAESLKAAAKIVNINPFGKSKKKDKDESEV